MLLQFVTFFAVHLHVGLLPCSFSLSVHLILYTPSLTPQRQPHARAGSHLLITFLYTHFTFGVYVFSSLQIHVVAAWFRFASPSFTTTHIHPLPFIRCNTLHSFILASPCFSQRSTFKQKNAPNWLPAAPCHRAPRFLCQGHSLNSHRLAHNAQAAYFVSFLYTRICLAIHARSRLFLLIGLNLLLPRQPPTTHP